MKRQLLILTFFTVLISACSSSVNNGSVPLPQPSQARKDIAPAPTLLPQFNIGSFFSSLQSLGIKFSSPVASSSSWNLYTNNIPHIFENIPTLSMSAEHITEDQIDTISNWLVNHGFKTNSENDGDGTIQGTRGFLSPDAFCHLNLKLVPAAGGGFSDFNDATLECGLVSDLK